MQFKLDNKFTVLKVKTANYIIIEQQLKWATKSDPRWLIQKCMTITTVMN